MVVGEAPGEQEVLHGEPFVGPSGVEMTKMLHEAGFLRQDCFITNACKERPPRNKIENFFGKKSDGLLPLSGKYPKPPLVEGIKELKAEVDEVKPRLIIAFGNTPLWALTGYWGITKWRGSLLQLDSGPVVLPTYHPAAILRNWDWRYIAVHDLRRARKFITGKIQPPEYHFTIRPSYSEALARIHELTARCMSGPTHISVDIETRHRQIACLGLAWSAQDAICIPFIDILKEDKSYWSLEEERQLGLSLQTLLLHPNCLISGQNLAYDFQYLGRQLFLIPRVWRDTMLTHHVCFAGLPKGLDFLSSLYLDWHEYWKDEGKNWNPKNTPEDQLWTYNCKDAVATWEVAERQSAVLESLSFPTNEHGAPNEIQLSLFPLVLSAMLRGVRVDQELKKSLTMKTLDEIAKREGIINQIAGAPLNVKSPKQLQDLFYRQLGQRVIVNYKTKRPTTDADALDVIAKREPLLEYLCTLINQTRQLYSSLAFCLQPLDLDKRIRCSYNVAGTETYRFSSSEDAFGFGTNLQNITKGEKNGDLEIPNLRLLFLADPGYDFGEFDLSAADAQVVAAEAEDWDLLEKIRSGFPLHDDNSQRWGVPRQIAKSCVHAANYGVTPYGLARNLGIKESLATYIIDDWFSRHPGVRQWHTRIERQLMERRYVENRFGYRRFYFDRIENLLKEALAWIPQSTVAIATNLGIRRVVHNVRWAQFLLQTHDSAGFQWPSTQTPEAKVLIPKFMQISIPYSRPLTIKAEPKIGPSWGACE